MPRRALAALLLGVAALLLAQLVLRPPPLTRLAFEQALGNADAPGVEIPMYWSLRVHDRDGWQRIQLEGGVGVVMPSRIRVVSRDGRAMEEGAMVPLEPGRTLGVCDTHALLGALWWARNLDPSVIASLATADGRYRVEALMPDGWRPVRLFDTGCRIVDRGRA